MRHAEPNRWAGVYWPTQRRPYGRRPGSRRFVDEAVRVQADWFWPGEVVTKHVLMPCGGYRTLAQCPACFRWATYLYSHEDCERFVCYKCARLVYRSEYERRRPEASWDRIQALRDLARKTRSAALRDHRLQRANAAAELFLARIDRFIEWRSVAVPLTFLTLYARAADRAARDADREAQAQRQEMLPVLMETQRLYRSYQTPRAPRHLQKAA